MLLATRRFVADGPSHLVVLAVTVIGALWLVARCRRDGERSERLGRVLATVIFLLNLGVEVARLRQATPIVYALPLQLSDLVPYASAYALWSRRRWACALTYYWSLTLSAQALLTPTLSGPDFPSPTFLAFFANHVLVIWAAVFLTWGVGMRPGWRGYWIAVALTACWAGVALAVNALTGTNFGFLSAKPHTRSLLDLLGPWPWYLAPEIGLVLAAWALITLPWLGQATVRNAPIGPPRSRG